MQPRPGYGGPFGPMNGPQFVEHAHHNSGRPFGWLFLFILLALIVALIVWIVLRVIDSRKGGRPAEARSADNALEVVRLRYAQGEIDRKEFLRITGDLGAPPEPPPAPSA